MLQILLILFLVVAAGGATLALLELRGRGLPLRLSAFHGIAALALLLVQVFTAPTNRMVNSAALVFVLAAVGGLFLFGLRLSRHKLPLGVVALHGAFALAALALLAAGVLRG